MKPILIFLSFFWLSACTTIPQKTVALNSQTKEERVKLRFSEFVEICKADDFKKAASYIAYRGDDKARSWKDVANSDNPEERNQVEIIVKGMHDLLNRSDKYTVTEYIINKQSEGEWNVLKVVFKQGKEQKQKHFAFLEVKGRFVIGDID